MSLLTKTELKLMDKVRNAKNKFDLINIIKCKSCTSKVLSYIIKPKDFNNKYCDKEVLILCLKHEKHNKNNIIKIYNNKYCDEEILELIYNDKLFDHLCYYELLKSNAYKKHKTFIDNLIRASKYS